MTRRALVLASQIRGLAGANADATHVARALADRDFAVDLRTDERARRAGVLDGWRTLIDDSTADDAALVYFAGHAARFVNPDPAAGSPGVPRVGQLILPTDYDETTTDDFRGITSWELSLLLAELTARTRNVTLLLDCCFAAHMARDGAGAIARGLPHPVRLGIARHLAELRARGARFEELDPLGNPLAVRVFAAGPDQCAWEYPFDGVYGGAFTNALLEALAATRGAAVTWATLGRAIRDRVLLRFASQWPELGGPAGRELFSTHVPAPPRAVAVTTRSGRTVVEAGRITGAQPGDTFRVVQGGATAGDPAGQVVVATIVEVGALESVVRLDPAVPAADGAQAFPLTQQLGREPVAVAGSGPEADELRARLAGAPRLRLADGTAGESPLAWIRVADGGATIADRLGPLAPPIVVSGGAGAAGLAAVVAFATDLAVARGLRTLAAAHDRSAAACEVAWGVVDGGLASERPPSGSLVALRDRIYLRIDNRSPGTTLYAHVFNVGSRGLVTRLSHAATLGILLRPGESFTVGDVPGRGLVGIGLTWPDDLARDRPRGDELYVLATTAPIDLAVLETRQVLVRGAIARGAPPFARLCAQLHDGGARDVDAGTVDGFVARRVEFLLDPRPRATAGLTGAGGCSYTGPVQDGPGAVAREPGAAEDARVGPPAPSTSATRVSRVDAAREREVLDRWRDGRRDEALRLLMTTYGGGVLAFARRMVRDDEAAQDVRQQTFLEAWRGLDRFEGRSSLWTWLCAIAFNRCLDAARRRERTNAGEVAVDFDVLEAVRHAPDQPMSPDRIAQREALEECLRRLPVAIRALVLMRAYQGLSYEEIAAIVGDPAGTVQVRLSRVLPKLRRCLQAHGVRP